MDAERLGRVRPSEGRAQASLPRHLKTNRPCYNRSALVARNSAHTLEIAQVSHMMGMAKKGGLKCIIFVGPPLADSVL